MAARALLDLTADPTANLSLIGLTRAELLPAKSADPRPARLPSKIDFAEAKRLFGEECRPYCEERVGTAVAVIDEWCVEYEWGWVIHWRPVEPAKGNPRFVNERHFPYTIDRVTGEVGLSGGTHGIERGIIELLQQRPPELRGPYPPGRQCWLVVIREFEAAGAFTPVGPPPSPESSDSVGA